jgi:NAD(P)H-flavin reductase/ferredoxin
VSAAQRSFGTHAGGPAMPFQVSIGHSGIKFPADADETVLDAAERAGYSLPYSCRKGVCSTCEAELRSGSVTVGSRGIEGPQAAVLLCRAKPKSDILIHPHRIERRDPSASARKVITARVFRLNLPAPDVVTMLLRFPVSIRAKFKAGQYLRILMPGGDTRNFSMANPPQESDGAHLHIRHVAGGKFSEEMLAHLKLGDTLDIELPYGEFFLREDGGKSIVCIATGTGFAPIKSIIEDMIKRRMKRPTRLYWGGRHRADLYMAELPEKWAARATWFSFVPVLSEPDPGWQGRRGLVHQAVLEDMPDLSSCQVYACGNPLMIRRARHEFETTAGLKDEQFFADPFVPSGDEATPP